MIARRRLGDQSNHIQVIVRSLGGSEVLSADAAPNTRVANLKNYVALELRLMTFGFDLLAVDGSKLDGASELTQYPTDTGSLELTMVKRSLPRTSSSRFLRLQSTLPEDSKPTFQGRQESALATRDIVMPRLLVLGLMLCMGCYLFYNEMPLKVWLILACIVYLIEALAMNPTARALRHMSDANDLVAHIAGVKGSRPVPIIEASCWHWETRTRDTVDSQGRRRTETFEGKVYSQTFTESLAVGDWADTSGDVVDGVGYFPLLQIHFELAWHAADEETVRTHDAARQVLHHRADAADRHHDFREFLRLSDGAGTRNGLKLTDMMCSSAENKPAWLGLKQYVLASLLGFSWPYRFWLARHSIKGDFAFSKEVWSHTHGRTGEGD